MTESLFQKAYEFEERYGIDRLKLCIEKAEKAYSTYQPETIDFCKCVIESICKFVYESKGESLSKNPDFHKLVGDTLELLGFKKGQVFGGIKSIALGICEIRNNKGIASHGHTDVCPLPTRLEIDLFVSICSNIIQIILSLLDNQEVDIIKTRLKFSKIDEFPGNHYRDQFIDKFSEIDYDSENGILFINGAELRPSEVLYTFDRMAYKEIFDKAFGSPAWEELYLDDFHNMISEEFSNLCKDFVPGNYGYEPPIINIYEYELKDNYIECNGDIETTVTIGASNDGEDFSYCSKFIARFSYSKDEPNLFQEHNLIKLILDKTNWF